MKKQLLTTALVAFGVATSAIAQESGVTNELNLDARFDHVSFNSNDAAAKEGYEAFQVSRLKLDYEGKVEGKYSFRTRFDLNKANNTPTVKDKSSTYVDFAYLTIPLVSDFSVIAGKHYIGLGGIEGSTSGGDIYLYSTAGAEVNTKFYATGLTAEYKMGDHKIRLTSVNNTEDIVSGTASIQKTALNGAIYTGKFMDGMLNLNLSNFTEKYLISGVQKTNSFTAAGLKVVHELFDVEADYLLNTYKYDPKSTSKVVNTQSSVVLARYKINPEMNVHLKYELTEQKKTNSQVATTEDKYKINAMTVAYEQKLASTQNLRWHAAYTQKNTTPDGGSKQTENIMYVGMRINTDIMK